MGLWKRDARSLQSCGTTDHFLDRLFGTWLYHPTMRSGDAGLIHCNVVFAGEDELVREAVGYEQQTAEAALSGRLSAQIGYR